MNILFPNLPLFLFLFCLHVFVELSQVSSEYNHSLYLYDFYSRIQFMFFATKTGRLLNSSILLIGGTEP